MVWVNFVQNCQKFENISHKDGKNLEKLGSILGKSYSFLEIYRILQSGLRSGICIASSKFEVFEIFTGKFFKKIDENRPDRS